MQHRLPKYRRTPESKEAVARRQITDRSLAIIQLLTRYHLLPTSLIIRLVPGNQDITCRHLQALFHLGLINRFSFPRLGFPSQSHYYLDNPEALRLLVDRGWAESHQLDFERVRRNKEKAYWRVNDPTSIEDSQGRLLFLKHETMISRFHAILDLACKESSGQVELTNWRQDTKLNTYVTAPKMRFNQQIEAWSETEDTERLPIRPDAFFTLRITSKPPGDQDLHFLYEADRCTSSGPNIAKKLRAHHQFILRQKDQRHIERHYGVPRIRAVLIETLDGKWGEHLRYTARSTIIAPKPSVIFWFTTSTLFTQPTATEQNSLTKPLPCYLTDPSIIFQRIWAAPTSDILYSLID